MKLYTRHGDTGQTSLVGGKRVSKDDIRIAVCGDLDELNAHIGLLLSFGVPKRESAVLIHVQQLLFHIGGELSIVDEFGFSCWPRPTTFVLPGGCTAAAESHICRTVTRRAERSMVAMSHQYRVDPLAMQYVNRLSDYFFVLALNLNFISSIDEKKLYISCK